MKDGRKYLAKSEVIAWKKIKDNLEEQCLIQKMMIKMLEYILSTKNDARLLAPKKDNTQLNFNKNLSIITYLH